MSKYTTQVRFICETMSGLSESQGFNSVDTVLNNSWNKIFTTNCAFFDESYRSVLCKKILKHYYLREIGAETVGEWQLWLNTRLEEIMSYYNKLYESANMVYNPLEDVNTTRTHKITNKGTNDTLYSSNQIGSDKKTTDVSSTGHNSTDTTHRDLYSETPQGAITNLENETYLTNARKIIDGQESENSNYYTDTTNTNNQVKTDGSTNNTINSTEDYIESVTGKQGSGSFSKLILEYRDSLLNIDMMVIEEFSNLFFGLW